MPHRYRPMHQTQVRDADTADAYDRFNCTADSAAMAFDYATIGGVRVSGEWIRAHSSEPIPDPDSPGLNLAQVLEVAGKLHIALYDRTGVYYSEFREAIAERRGVILQGDRDRFTTFPCVSAFKGPHAIFVSDFDPSQGFWVNDPLCQKGHWTPADAVKAYAIKLGRDTGLGDGRIRFAETRPVPTLA